jgi:hypothetical protein
MELVERVEMYCTAPVILEERVEVLIQQDKMAVQVVEAHLDHME